MAEPQQEGKSNGAPIRDVNHDDNGRGLFEESSSDDDTSMDGDSSMDDGSSDDDIEADRPDEDDDIPTPDELELEYTYPDDFQDRAWKDVIGKGHYCRLIINCEAVRDIPRYKFYGCRWLIEIVFLNNNKNNQRNILRYIGPDAFYKCLNLQRIRNGLPVGLVTLGRGAFRLCESLQQGLTFPRSVLLIDGYCFYGCRLIPSVAFDHLPTDPLKLREAVFSRCSELRSVTLPMSLRLIPQDCFHECVLLIHIPIPINVRVIECGAFHRCYALRHIDLSENITEIRHNAYADCTSLETVTIKSSNVQFGDHVFVLCSSLSTIKVYPWVLPRLFAATDGRTYVMQGLTTDDSNFRYKFLRKSQHQLAQFRRR